VTAFLRRRLKHIADVRFSNVDKLAEAGEAPVRLCNYTDVYNNERIDAAMPFMYGDLYTTAERRFSTRTYLAPCELSQGLTNPQYGDIAVCGLGGEAGGRSASLRIHLSRGAKRAARRSDRPSICSAPIRAQVLGIRQQFYRSAQME
jgi:hypothetical protein